MPSSKEEIKDILAQRTLTFKRHDGQVFACEIILGKIQEASDGLSFFCPTQILGYGIENIMNIHGIDSYQALTLAIESTYLKICSYAEDGTFTWMDLDPQILPRDLWSKHSR